MTHVCPVGVLTKVNRITEVNVVSLFGLVERKQVAGMIIDLPRNYETKYELLFNGRFFLFFFFFFFYDKIDFKYYRPSGEGEYIITLEVQKFVVSPM